MEWTQVIIKTTEEASDAISEMLTSIGAGGVVIEDPNEIRRQIESPDSLDYADQEFIDSLGTEVTIKAYFNEEYRPEELGSLINEKLEFISKFLDVGRGYIGFEMVNDEDWSTAWKKYYKPFHISDSVVIKPSWEEYQKKPGELIIEMDPGMAFGTGTHETTRLCSQLLEKHIKRGDRVIDVGCGTGILSIIAVKLGAAHATAIDVDEVAVRVADENCTINGVSDKVSIMKGVLADLEPQRADVAVANIIADVVIGFADMVTKYLKRGGLLLTSGIIKERKEDVVNTYTALGFRLESIDEMGEWVAIAFKCPDSL
ncbi:MAG: 50S ribosomal protein L11 methyltransferase [Clostridiaceae bacterium]|nr:50S ribosomal protein L11 methyltransferase [Clostridiaceae bacterium]